MLQVSRLFVYPIKSLPGIELQAAKVTQTGLEHDRRWMLVDEDNIFISQREAPQMTQLSVAIENEGLRVRHKTKDSSIFIRFDMQPQSRNIVSIWDDNCIAEYLSCETDSWFSEMLGIRCRLVHMPADCRRFVEPLYAPKDALTSFSDAYPFMMIGQASLNELNSRMAIPLPMDRFRPNIVFTGGEPFEEDRIGDFTIGDISFSGVKLCARCNIPTIDQDTGLAGKEPLKTLASYRAKNNKIYFGQNLVHRGEGMITVGDCLQVLSRNHEERFMINEKV